jgi:hypothetical protein
VAARRYRVDEVLPALLDARAAVESMDGLSVTDRATVRELGSFIDSAAAGRADHEPADDLVEQLITLVLLADQQEQGARPGSVPEIPPGALRIVVRSLLDMLATRAPGNSLEVRVPPFAAVQCIEGPRHTRGTPPNVVETDPWTWIRMASGRIGWDQALASHAVQASGSRADLGDLLPLL